jgi:hypothetical protein
MHVLAASSDTTACHDSSARQVDPDRQRNARLVGDLFFCRSPICRAHESELHA